MAAMHKQIRFCVGMSGTMQMWHFMEVYVIGFLVCLLAVPSHLF